VSADKQTLRLQLRKQRAALPTPVRDACELATCRRILAWLYTYTPKGATLGLYVPIKDELNILGLVPELLEMGYSLCLPAVSTDTDMVFKVWDGTSKLTPDAKKILTSDGLPCTPDVICVPLLGFDRRGHRLGYGAGYYDRYLAANTHRSTLGVAFALQELPHIPEAAHDQPLNWVITEKEMISCQV